MIFAVLAFADDCAGTVFIVPSVRCCGAFAAAGPKQLAAPERGPKKKFPPNPATGVALRPSSDGSFGRCLPKEQRPHYAAWSLHVSFMPFGNQFDARGSDDPRDTQRYSEVTGIRSRAVMFGF